MSFSESPAHPSILKAFKEAFTATLPIAAGFLFIGAAYGFYMRRMGFSFWYPMLMAMIIFGGSLEFVTVTMLLSPLCPAPGFSHGAHDSGASPILWHCHAGPL